MNMGVVAFIYLILLFALTKGESLNEYLQQRNDIVQQEVDLSLAGLINLNSKEIEANNILTTLQAKEIILMGDNFPPAMNFLQGKGWIDNSSIVFSYLRDMPKGAALHQHLDSTGSYYNLVYNLTYKYPCYMYQGDGGSGYEAGDIDCFESNYVPDDGPWVSLASLREKNRNFDNELYLNLTLIGRDFGDYYQLWKKFDGVFGTVALLQCKEVFSDYLAHMFYELRMDNIQYAEFRTPPIILHDLQNNKYNVSEFIEVFEEVSAEANFSAKLIYAASRSISNVDALQNMQVALQLIEKYPDTVVGFDLDGPEDEGHTLLYFINEFLQINNVSGNSLKYFFHAGETIFLNNTNLYDAVLLNTTRIGHGFQLNKHPLLVDEVKSRGICIEICPISNQILELSPDMRTHPGYEYFNRGLPIVLSSDDPSIYGYEGTSYDFYEAFMAWNIDIRGLKQLAINSIECSVWNNDQQKQQVFDEWNNAWNTWIDNIVG